MTNAQLAAAEQARTKAARRVQFEQGINSPVRLTGRQPNKRGYSRARDRQASRKEIWS